MHQVLAEYGISVGQFMALNCVATHPGINRADLGRALQVTPQAASGVITQLVERDLLGRAVSQRGLPIALSLTSAGCELLGQVEPAVEALGQQMLLRCVRPDALASMDGAFRHVFRRLSADQEPEQGRKLR
jgi:DNA-binding MarR family transcriptional regulator